jgi:transposase
VRWITRVPHSSREACATLTEAEAAWQSAQQAAGVQWVPVRKTPLGERWVVCATAGEERAHATLAHQVAQTRQVWEQQLWHLGNRRFACEADAYTALAQLLKKSPDCQEWQIVAILTLEDEALKREGQRKASLIVATNVLDPEQLSDLELIQTYRDQGSVERGFAFLKDPLFVASSVFVETPAHRGLQPRDGAVSLGLSAGRASLARAVGCRRPDGAQPTQATDRSANDAPDLPVLRRRDSRRVPALSGTTTAG